MFINIKLSKLFKIFFSIVAIIMVIIFAFSAFKIYSNSKNTVSDSSVIEISPNNYTNVLKTVHEDLDSYIGKTIHFSGFVYRVFDLSDTQFVLARNMIIDADNRSVVVGFLCNYNDAKNFADTTWVDVTGTIIKGSYHGDMPIIEVTDMHKTDCPSDEFVYPPDNSFVPTNSII